MGGGHRLTVGPSRAKILKFRNMKLAEKTRDSTIETLLYSYVNKSETRDGRRSILLDIFRTLSEKFG